MLVKNDRIHVFLFVSLLVLLPWSGKASQFADLCRAVENSQSNFRVGHAHIFVTGGQVNLTKETTVTERVFIQGNFVIDGGNNRLVLAEDSRFMVGENSTLTFKNIIVDGLFHAKVLDCFLGNIFCSGNGSGKILCNNVTWRLIGDFTFKKGNIEVDLNSSFKMENVCDISLCHEVKFCCKTEDWLCCKETSTFELDGVEVEYVPDDPQV